jgi:O-antigen ligase
VLAGTALAGLVIANEPVFAVAAFAIAAFVGVTIVSTEVATLAVVFLIFTNIPAIAVTEYGAPRMAGAAVPLLLAVPFATYLSRGERGLAGRGFLLMLLLLIVNLLSTILSSYQDVASEKLLTFGIEGVLLYFLVVNVVRTRLTLRRALWVILAAGACMAALTVYQKVAVGFYRPLGGFGKVDPSYLLGKVDVPRAAGALGDPNYYAQVLLVAAAIGLMLLRTERDVVRRAAAGAATALVAYAVVLTYSRGAALAFVVVVLLMAGMRYFSATHLIAMLLAVVLLLGAVPEYSGRLANLSSLSSATTDAGTDPGAEISARSRTTEMLAAVLVFADHPVLGVGPAGFPRYYQDYADRIGIEVRETALWGERAGQEAQRQSHNMFLSVAADLGLPGLFIFCGLIFVTLRELLHTRRRARRATEHQRAHGGAGASRLMADLASTVMLAIVAYVACGLFLTLAFERYFWLLLGLGGAATAIGRRESEPAAGSPS